MQAVGAFRAVALAVGACLLAGSAIADIKSFNAAMQAKDYKLAAAEAASTWPTLSKTRDDLAIIAREFGFAAYLANDFKAAKMFGDAAVAASSALDETPVFRGSSEILLRLAEHRLAPTQGSRDVLYAATEARASDETIDLITFFATDAVAAFDFAKGDWQKAAVSAGLGERLTKHGGPEYAAMHYRFALLAASAGYLINQSLESHIALVNVERRVTGAIAAAASDEDAAALVPIYYDAQAWTGSTETHLTQRKAVRDWTALEANETAYRETETYKKAFARIRKDATPNACKVDMSGRSKSPEVPSDPRFRNMMGTVIASLDIASNGKTSNARLLGAMPGTEFGEAVLKELPSMTFRKQATAEPGCSLGQNGYVLTMVFILH